MFGKCISLQLSHFRDKNVSMMTHICSHCVGLRPQQLLNTSRKDFCCLENPQSPTGPRGPVSLGKFYTRCAALGRHCGICIALVIRSSGFAEQIKIGKVQSLKLVESFNLPWPKAFLLVLLKISSFW